ncbi:surface-adhesin E family protein [Brevundimonas sp.]|uniref:surface-adhesin E family protein n=1 Tax=Brevundimonas sp. TaxID=1871086 RepID=UPI003F7079CE
MKIALTAAAALILGATPALAEDWHAYSRTATRAYLADVASIATVDGVTTIQSASVPMTGAASETGHTQTIYQFQCDAGKWRTAGESEYAADGTHEDYPEEGAAWETLRPNTIPDFIKQIACDGSRSSTATFPTIRAFLDAGRP